MRTILIAATVAFACLGVARASAETLRINDGHAAAEFGVGGWTQHNAARTVASGGASVAKSQTVVSGSDRVFRGLQDFDRRLHWLGADSDCLAPPTMAAADRPWRQGCK
jgi:hypothetical protein